MKSYFIMFLSGSLLTIGDIAMKKWVVSKYHSFYLFGMLAYFIGLNFLAKSYTFKNLAVATIIINIINVVTLSLVSCFIFKDALSTKQIIGLCLAILAITILEL